jgi:isoquinoline 1-oxidoreductase alpha subunit
MTAAALLRVTPSPSDAEIDAALSGSVCRCGTFDRMRRAIRRAAAMGAR